MRSGNPALQESTFLDLGSGRVVTGGDTGTMTINGTVNKTGLLLLLVAGMVFGLLWGQLGEMRIPVFCYMLVIIAMAWVAAGAWHASLTAGSAAALVGALMFLFSDSMLALDRFRRPFPHATAWIMSSYFAAQFLIAASLAG